VAFCLRSVVGEEEGIESKRRRDETVEESWEEKNLTSQFIAFLYGTSCVIVRHLYVRVLVAYACRL
jgi:hypothetical protein